MFSNVGWGEVLVLLIVALFLIGPERLPGLIKEARAMLLAVRKAVSQAKEQIDGELGEDFREFSKPLQELNSVRQMGAKGFISKTLLDDDDSFLTSFNETKQDVKDTVDTVRKPNLREALKADKNKSSAEPQPAPASGSADNGGIAVTQQSNAGESRSSLDSPVAEAAEQLTGDAGNPDTAKEKPSAPGYGWEDVT
ncbi:MULTISPECIES: Sec-independent protein translocase subunit TatB [unclassified Corynebacterium]|uniref:Sec-independent protein translocase subunit TatB n=1 Tax=unclassified Corynebacterium TaxID=2624378 RepID=UPI001EF48D55|nr:Sec-independent protein translocase subunit TatB [Corynebacterium sp. ACRQK]MCG7262617.1 Sec-independent protein translocase subunit TatB [Corynebacterium sp. ACRQL]